MTSGSDAVPGGRRRPLTSGSDAVSAAPSKPLTPGGDPVPEATPRPIAELVDELAELFRRGGTALAGDAVFNRLALRVHEAQRACTPVLRRYWEAVSDGEPSAWYEIPPVPVRAFRDTPIVAGPAEVVFRTSGTSGGGARRGEHHVASLELYRAAARGSYRRHLFAGARSLHVVSLVPDPAAVPDSSLATMAGFISREPEVARVAWAFDPAHGVDVGAVREAVAAAIAPSPGSTRSVPPPTRPAPQPTRPVPPPGSTRPAQPPRPPAPQPVLLLATAFALVQLLDALGGDRLHLPPGSRVMETGGFKGRANEVDRATLHRRLHRALGVPQSHIVGEYGMTEMLSQGYDCVVGQGTAPDERAHRFPPWVRTRALDPADLSPLPPGRPGLLAHFDLANAASVCHLLTEDYGSVTADGGVRLLGRAPGAAVRGCSLTAEAFLRASGGGAAASGAPGTARGGAS